MQTPRSYDSQLLSPTDPEDLSCHRLSWVFHPCARPSQRAPLPAMSGYRQSWSTTEIGSNRRRGSVRDLENPSEPPTCVFRNCSQNRPATSARCCAPSTPTSRAPRRGSQRPCFLDPRPIHVLFVVQPSSGCRLLSGRLTEDVEDLAIRTISRVPLLLLIVGICPVNLSITHKSDPHCESQFDVRQAAEAAPNHHVSRWRVSFASEVAAESCQLRDVMGVLAAA